VVFLSLQGKVVVLVVVMYLMEVTGLAVVCPVPTVGNFSRARAVSGYTSEISILAPDPCGVLCVVNRLKIETLSEFIYIEITGVSLLNWRCNIHSVIVVSSFEIILSFFCE